LRQPRIGHAGTLDPEAKGVLPVLVGKATRIAEYLLVWDKEYRAVLRLGETTDTLDAGGRLLEVRDATGLTEARIRDVLPGFQGTLLQTPPMYSAVKVGGRPLYKAARAGLTVAREPREVVIHELHCEQIVGRDVWLRVVCAKGTYVRALCADIGEALGVGGHLRSLERTRVGPLRVEDSATVEEIGSRMTRGEWPGALLSLDEALAHLPSVTVTDAACGKVRHGIPLAGVDLLDDAAVPRTGRGGEPVRVKDESGRVLAIGRMPETPSGVVVLRKVFMGAEEAGSAPE
jgi:tRNA pseudouridine55 synthase